MVKMIDSLLYSPTLSRVVSSTVNRKKATATFNVSDEIEEGVTEEKSTPQSIQTSQKVQRLSLLNLSDIKNIPEQEIISYGDCMLDQLKRLQYQLLDGDVSYEQLQELEMTFSKLPSSITSISSDLKEIIDDIQIRVAVELAKLSNNRS